MQIEKILVVDDDALMRRFLQEALTRKGYTVEIASQGKEALLLLKKHTFDLLLTDMKMPELSGIELLRRSKELVPHMLSIVMTAYGTIENAVEAMKLGAFNYLLKPFTVDALDIMLERATDHLSLVHENIYLREESVSKRLPIKIIAESPSMQKILSTIYQVAKSQASVLVHGESGTGKEVVVAAIHAHSLRTQQPYIRVNCAAIPDSLIESEFFGHEKGAFTGAHTKKLGRFELADKGTLLLDEVTEIPIGLQPKLLRAIQEQEFERVGGTKTITVDVRLVSTSNRNLQEAIESKIFREDLFYRLNVISIHLPPLRERKEDILPLAHFFLSQFCSKNRKEYRPFSADLQHQLLAYHWPGNIRELANTIERMVVLDACQGIDIVHDVIYP